MHEKELMKWLERNNLLSIVKNHYRYFKNLLIKGLNIKKDQEILILGDWGSHGHRLAPIICGAYYLCALNLGYKVNVIMQGPKTRSETASDEIINGFSEFKEGNIVLMAFSNRPGGFGKLGKSWRRLCYSRKHRFISTGSLGGLENKDIYIITRALNVNYDMLKNTASKIKKTLDLGRKINITTEAGTNITADITGCKSIAVDGDYTGSNRGGNMPAGEVYIPPITGSVNGKIVIDGSSRNDYGTIIIEEPIKLTVKRSQIIRIEGGREARLLGKTLKNARELARNPSNVTKISEIGIGINPNIEIVGSMVVDEKAFNTAHIAIGSNYWFGGDIITFLHLDQVMRNPTIIIDGKRLEY